MLRMVLHSMHEKKTEDLCESVSGFLRFAQHVLMKQIIQFRNCSPLVGDNMKLAFYIDIGQMKLLED